MRLGQSNLPIRIQNHVFFKTNCVSKPFIVDFVVQCSVPPISESDINENVLTQRFYLNSSSS